MTPELAPAPCVLRMLAGSTAFDPSWTRTLDADVVPPLWGYFVAGPDERVLTRVARDVEGVRDANELGSTDIWSWWMTPPDGAPAEPFPSLPLDSGATQTYRADGKTIVISYDNATSSTTLVDTTGEGGPEFGVTVPGYVYNVLRIR